MDVSEAASLLVSLKSSNQNNKHGGLYSELNPQSLSPLSKADSPNSQSTNQQSSQTAPVIRRNYALTQPSSSSAGSSPLSITPVMQLLPFFQPITSNNQSQLSVSSHSNAGMVSLSAVGTDALNGSRSFSSSTSSSHSSNAPSPTPFPYAGLPLLNNQTPAPAISNQGLTMINSRSSSLSSQIVSPCSPITSPYHNQLQPPSDGNGSDQSADKSGLEHFPWYSIVPYFPTPNTSPTAQLNAHQSMISLTGDEKQSKLGPNKGFLYLQPLASGTESISPPHSAPPHLTTINPANHFNSFGDDNEPDDDDDVFVKNCSFNLQPMSCDSINHQNSPINLNQSDSQDTNDSQQSVNVQNLSNIGNGSVGKNGKTSKSKSKRRSLSLSSINPIKGKNLFKCLNVEKI